MDIGDGLSFRREGDERFVYYGDRRATRDDIPPRYDLDPGHTLYGRRVLKSGFSGMSDTELGDDGNLVSLDYNGNPRR